MPEASKPSGPSPAEDEVPVDLVVAIDEQALAAALEQVRAKFNARVAELTEPVREMVARAYHAGVADGQRAAAAVAK